MRLEGKTAIVTGGASGFGAGIVQKFLTEGARVMIADINGDAARHMAATLGTLADHRQVDVSDGDSVQAMADAALGLYGHLDILVNNAGVAGSRHCLNVDEGNWDYIMDTNLKGAWRVAQAVAARSVAARRPCSIINIASILGLRVGFGESAYSVSKAGVVQLTRALALELAAKEIRVNAICPGYFATEMNSDYLHSEEGQAYLERTPARRMGELDELSGPLLLLASGAGSFVNGAIIPVDGGHLVSSL